MGENNDEIQIATDDYRTALLNKYVHDGFLQTSDIASSYGTEPVASFDGVLRWAQHLSNITYTSLEVQYESRPSVLKGERNVITELILPLDLQD